MSSSAAPSSPSASPVSLASPVAAVPAPPAPAARRAKRGLVAIVLLVLVALGVGGWFFAHRGLVTTDDAEIDADVVAVPSRVAGTVKKVHFADDQSIVGGVAGKTPDVTVTYEIKRVTAANWADAAA